MERKYAELYRELYQEHWWWRARSRILENLLTEMYGGRTDLRILDIGCGDGLFFETLERIGIVEGIEPTAEMVSAEKLRDGKISVRKFDSSFVPNHTYDLILMLDVIEDVEEDLPFLEHARDLLSPNGQIIVTVPALQLLWTSHDDVNHHFRRYDRKMLARVATEAKLQITSMEYCFAWVGIAKLGIVLKERLFGKSSELERVPSRFINALLLRLCLLDHKIVSITRVPFGSSLVAVLRK